MEIYILCHNRPDFARQAIRSVLGQSCRDFTLKVSDNSSNDDVEQMVRAEFPEISYIRRIPMLKSSEHFNCCIDEVQSEYFCLFHDDDVMGSDFVEAVRACLKIYPKAIACGCNAKIESFGEVEARTSFRSLREVELICSPRNLAMRYFSFAQSGIAPFPGYVYSRLLVGDQRTPIDAGKYADVIWLLSLAEKETIVWINMPLMTYRIHSGSDGGVESLRDRLRLFGFLKKNRKLFGNGLLNDYRSFIYKKILKPPVGPRSRRYRLIGSFLKNYRWSRYARFDYWRAIALHTLVKMVAKK